MSKFVVTVEELLQHEVVVECNSREEAEEKFWEMYRAEDIVLDSGDYVATEVVEVGEIQ